jgi:hypothetical protein
MCTTNRVYTLRTAIFTVRSTLTQPLGVACCAAASLHAAASQIKKLKIFFKKKIKGTFLYRILCVSVCRPGIINFQSLFHRKGYVGFAVSLPLALSNAMYVPYHLAIAIETFNIYHFYKYFGTVRTYLLIPYYIL